MPQGKKRRRASEVEPADAGEQNGATIEFPSAEPDDEEEELDDLPRHGKAGKSKSGGFQSMGLSPMVYRSVMRKGYRVPTPIQRRAIPSILAGQDVVAMARTGSGAPTLPCRCWLSVRHPSPPLSNTQTPHPPTHPRARIPCRISTHK